MPLVYLTVVGKLTKVPSGVLEGEEGEVYLRLMEVEEEVAAVVVAAAAPS